jgi:calcineurin-like phosphoesterase family protein
MADIFTSDLHFFHKNICEFSGRPWIQEENEDRLVELWNSQVKEDDTLWHLGDFFFANASNSGAERAARYLQKLNGTIHCIQGNHDNSKLWAKIFERLHIDKKVTMQTYREIKIGSTKVCMSHYPMVVWNQSQRGSIQLHGHCHGSLHNLGKSIDMGLDGAKERLGEWRFWTEQDILDYASKLDIYAPDMHSIKE